MIRVAILGASGFVGAELLRLCASHPQLEPVRLFGDSQAGLPLETVHPQLALAYPGLTVERYAPELLEGVDLVFAALPHGHSQKLAAEMIARDVAFVDLGADFRLDSAEDYETWYKEPHQAPELLSRFVYGIPELHRERIRGAKLVAAAGCYPTSAILALRPLIEAIDPASIVVDAASGVTGAGRGLKEETHFNTVDENFSAYGLLGHRHTAEMEMALGGKVLFTPHLAPMNRGILATCYAQAKGPCDPLALLRNAYQGEPFVHVSERPPSTKWTLGSNAVHLTARYDARTGRVLAIAALDNLVKGAAGQMIQCANLMLGLDETAGLPRVGSLPVSVTAAEGFVASGLHAGIKARRYDMALVATDDRQPVTAAAVFTRNKFFAPPVAACRERLAANGGRAAAIIVNSGNANAGTGAAGRADSEAMCEAAAEALGIAASDVLVCSTGIIGTPLPMDRILAATPKLAKKLSVEGGKDAAKGILTTDHKVKEAVIRGSTFTLGGMAKGCGMIAPNMATMLAFLTTDADVPADQLTVILRDAADRTFNTLNVDGATSTNDTVIILASGRRGRPDMAEFADAVHRLCEDLTYQMARDAEGMTKMVQLRVTGARSDAEARAAAKSIAENNLVKCSWYGGDPYWGRLLGAAGSAGIDFEAEKTAVSYGGIVVSRGGTNAEHDHDAVAAHMKNETIEIEVALGLGSGEAQVIGIDLGPGYIKENSKTS